MKRLGIDIVTYNGHYGHLQNGGILHVRNLLD